MSQWSDDEWSDDEAVRYRAPVAAWGSNEAEPDVDADVETTSDHRPNGDRAGDSEALHATASATASAGKAVAEADEKLDNANAEADAVSARLAQLSVKAKQNGAANGASLKPKKRKRRRKKKDALPDDAPTCNHCKKRFRQEDGKMKMEKFYCNVCHDLKECQQCFVWISADFGKPDPNDGVWYCGKCWRKWTANENQAYRRVDPNRYASDKMRRMEKQWGKGGQW